MLHLCSLSLSWEAQYITTTSLGLPQKLETKIGKREKAEMVWGMEEWIYWTEDAEFGASREEETRETTEKIQGCNERRLTGHLH